MPQLFVVVDYVEIEGRHGEPVSCTENRLLTTLCIAWSGVEQGGERATQNRAPKDTRNPLYQERIAPLGSASQGITGPPR